MSNKPASSPSSPRQRAGAKQSAQQNTRDPATSSVTPKSAQSPRLTPLKLYLLAYNAISCLLWFTILLITLHHVLTDSPRLTSKATAANVIYSTSKVIPESTNQAKSLFNFLLSSATSLFSPSSTTNTKLPSSTTTSSALAHYLPFLSQVENRLGNAYNHNNLGSLVKYTQSLAVLEVLHAALGLVRSPVGTTAAQVASRVWTVWGVVEACPETHTNPLFTTMVFAWSLTETIRYAFYGFNLLGIDIPALTWARYSLFTLLYPLGASSEAFLSLSTLPPFSAFSSSLTTIPLKTLTSILEYLPPSAKARVLRTELGRNMLWRMAKAETKAKASKLASGLAGSGAGAGAREWGGVEVGKLVLFVGWWPALYVLYTHMLKQRRKVLGKGAGRTLGGGKKLN